MKKEGFVGGNETHSSIKNDPINPDPGNINTLPNLAFTNSTENIQTNVMSIQKGSNIVDNRLLDTSLMDWDSFVDSGNFDNGANYILSLYGNAEDNGSALALPVELPKPTIFSEGILKPIESKNCLIAGCDSGALAVKINVSFVPR